MTIKPRQLLMSNYSTVYPMSLDVCFLELDADWGDVHALWELQQNSFDNNC